MPFSHQRHFTDVEFAYLLLFFPPKKHGANYAYMTSDVFDLVAMILADLFIIIKTFFYYLTNYWVIY